MSSKMDMITRANCRTLQQEAEEVLKLVAEQYGLTLEMGGARYTSDNATLKFTFGVTARGAEQGSRGEPVNFGRDAQALGLPPDCFGEVFQSRGTAYRITGISLRRHKYPVSAERVSDKRQFKFPTVSVRMGLGV